MSVYTPLQLSELEPFLACYDCGAALQLEPIHAGVSNSNFYLQTEAGEWVLTLYENQELTSLHYLLNLQAHLHRKGILVARPQTNRHGHFLKYLKNKPAALIQRLPGESCAEPDLGICQQIGRELARLHLAAVDFDERRTNPRGPLWWLNSYQRLKPRLKRDEIQIIEHELHELAGFKARGLPRGAIHADLFRDNVLTREGQLQGIIDFDFACNEVLLFDLAVSINDWCINSDGELDRLRMRELIAAYNEQRPLLQAEHQALPIMLRAAALRFWLSRLLDQHFPSEGEQILRKDPEPMRHMLLLRRQPLSGIQNKPGKRPAPDILSD